MGPQKNYEIFLHHFKKFRQKFLPQIFSRNPVKIPPTGICWTQAAPHSPGWGRHLQVRRVIVIGRNDVRVGVDALVPKLTGARQVVRADLVLLRAVLPGHPVVPIGASFVLAFTAGPIATCALILPPMVGFEVVELAKFLAEFSGPAEGKGRRKTNPTKKIPILPPPLAHRPVKDRFLPGGGVVGRAWF